MQANTPVIITGLASRADLNGKDGVAEVLTRSGRFVVRVSGEEERFKLKPSNLIVKDHIEETSGDIIIVNGFSYCAAHRLECCGACTYNFRIQNRLVALNDKSGDLGEKEERTLFAVAEALDKEEANQNLPPLRAPLAGKPIADREPPKTRLNTKELISKGLDPAAELQEWSISRDGKVSKPFRETFSVQELLGFENSPELVLSPALLMRKMLLVVAYECDKKVTDPSYLLPRFAIQDEAQSECIMWDVLEIHKEEIANLGISTKAYPSPLITVRWAYYTSASMQRLLKSGRASWNLNPKGTTSVEFPAEVVEIRLFKQLLETSSSRLDSRFVQRLSTGLPEGWAISTIRPVTTEISAVRETVPCAACGMERASNVCSKCKEARYCSRECQVAHWPAHKKSGLCNKREDSAQLVSVDLGATSPDFLKGQVSSFGYYMSNSRSISLSKANVVADLSKNATAHKADSIFIVKIQNSMNLTAETLSSMSGPVSSATAAPCLNYEYYCATHLS
jgi:hypothetical protein